MILFFGRECSFIRMYIISHIGTPFLKDEDSGIYFQVISPCDTNYKKRAARPFLEELLHILKEDLSNVSTSKICFEKSLHS